MKFTLMQLILFSGLLASTTMAMEWDTPDNNQTDLENFIMQKIGLLNSATIDKSRSNQQRFTEHYPKVFE